MCYLYLMWPVSCFLSLFSISHVFKFWNTAVLDISTCMKSASSCSTWLYAVNPKSKEFSLYNCCLKALEEINQEKWIQCANSIVICTNNSHFPDNIVWRSISDLHSAACVVGSAVLGYSLVTTAQNNILHEEEGRSVIFSALIHYY